MQVRRSQEHVPEREMGRRFCRGMRMNGVSTGLTSEKRWRWQENVQVGGEQKVAAGWGEWDGKAL